MPGLAFATASAFSETALKPRPGGSISPFCEPATETSMPQASCSYSIDPRPEMVSTISSAGCLTRSSSLRTSSGGVTQPVEVSLWTTQTALIACCLSAARRFSISARSAPWRQSLGMKSTSSLNLSAMPRQHSELAGLAHQHLVAGGEHVDHRSFPSAGAGRGEDDHGLLGAEHPLHAGEDGETELCELRTAVIQRRHVHGPQHPVGHVGRSWNLEKMPSSVHGHRRPSRSLSLSFASVLALSST